MATDLGLDDDTDDTDSSDDSPVAVTTPAAHISASPSAMNPAVSAYLQKLQTAQSQAKQNQLGTGLTAALTQLGHGLSRAPGQADLSAVKMLGANDNAPVDNFNAQQTGVKTALQNQTLQEATDPNSQKSQAFRNSLKLVAPKIADAYGDQFAQITAADAPDILKSVDLKAQLDQRAQAAKDRADAQRDSAQTRADTAQAVAATRSAGAASKGDEKEAQDIAKAIDPNGARAGNFGKAGSTLMAAQRVKAILDQFPDGNVPKAQTEELATAAAAMIGGGSVQSQQQLAAIVPQSAMGDAQSLAGWLSNEPRGLQQQAFIKNLADSANREGQVAQNQVDTIRAQRLGAHVPFAQRNPERFGQILRAYGMDPANMDLSSGVYKIPTTSGQSATPASKPPVIQNGHTYNWNPQTGKYE